jgi:transcriptional regulator with PAS, ATPase and Fis domain
VNQPVAAIRMFADNSRAFLERGQLDVTANNLGEIIVLSDRLIAMTNQLRGFARKSRQTLSAVNLVTNLARALALVEVSLGQLGIEVIKDLPDQPIWVIAEEGRLQQVLVNLLRNAIDAIKHRQQRVIVLKVYQQSDWGVFAIHDSGPGIAEDQLTKALSHLAKDWPGVLLTDVRMPEMDGLALMREAHRRDLELPVIMITSYGDIAAAVQAIREGAYDFIEKHYPSELLLDAVKRALERRRLILENRALKAELANKIALATGIMGNSPAIKQLRGDILCIADVNANVLITGETGTGKELVARALHQHSTRKSCHFVAVDCGAISREMIEDELFGHVRGAFTGAINDRAGKFEYAQGGTVFLGELDSMPLPHQVKLLRVLQEKKVVRLGSKLLKFAHCPPTPA